MADELIHQTLLIKKYINAQLKILKKENEEMKKELNYVKRQLNQINRLLNEDEDDREQSSPCMFSGNNFPGMR